MFGQESDSEAHTDIKIYIAGILMSVSAPFASKRMGIMDEITIMLRTRAVSFSWARVDLNIIVTSIIHAWTLFFLSFSFTGGAIGLNLIRLSH